jgi:putative endopeptidase
MTTRDWGFDVRNMNKSIRPQDDFFEYANGGWRKKNPVPPSESRWGSFMKLRYKVDEQLSAILKELLSEKRAAKGSPEQIIRDFYKSGMDIKRRDTLDLRPLASYRKQIMETASIDALVRVIATLSRFGSEVPWATYVDQDDRDSTKYVLRFVQSGLGMPERDYYLHEDAESLRVRTAYKIHVEKLYRLMGSSPREARTRMEAHLSLETALARASMKKEDRRDPHKIYHKLSLSKLSALSSEVDWARYLKDIGAGGVKTVIVSQPDFLKEVSRLFKTEPLSVWQHYVDWHLVNNFSNALSARFIRQSFSFYGTTLSGTKKLRPLWRRVLNAVNGNVGELLGRIYVKKHFPVAAKKKMESLVADLFEAYEARIKTLEWMSPVTKKKALQKLHSLNRKIGYPHKWRSYASLVITPTDYVGNLVRANELEHRRQMRKLKSKVDRGEWFMYPQTVNAYFSPNLNDIVFPAAILQPPFFNLEGDDAVNYGAIGAVIGHEITHGFDDEGSKFDAKGNLKSWWTKEDRARFEKRAKVLKEQFDRYEVADGVKVNGKLTLGENIADLGGAAIALDAYKLRAIKNAEPLRDGFSPTERFFLGFAVFECENTRPEFEKMQVLTDPHSPGKFRINGPASNLPEFYAAFGVQKGDTLYRAPKDRAKIW